jgi:hypothetical protein
MSKKKKKKAKPATRKAAPKSAKRATARPRATQAVGTGRTSQVTIFIYRTASGNKIRTSPQRAFAGPGHIEWTVVNLVDGSNVPVTITWPEGGPWGKEAVQIRENGWNRLSVSDAKPGVYKYVVSALDAQEDPEIEIPEM